MAVGILEEIKQLSGRTHTRTDGFDGGPIQLRYPGVLRQTGCQGASTILCEGISSQHLRHVGAVGPAGASAGISRHSAPSASSLQH